MPIRTISKMFTLDEIEIRPTELVYATAIDYTNRTFFAQQCKHTNAELVEHNKQIHEYCDKIFKAIDKKSLPAINPIEGEVLCAQFKEDLNWYRVMVRSRDDEKRTCNCYFVDYGNTETISYDHLLRITPENVPNIKRAAFGFFAIMVDMESHNASSSKHLLDCLFNEYLMVRDMGQIGENLWRVELPRVAYNTTFWVASEQKKSS